MTRNVEISIVEGDIYMIERVLGSGRMSEAGVRVMLREKALLTEKLALLQKLAVTETSLATLRQMGSLPNDGWDL